MALPPNIVRRPRTLIEAARKCQVHLEKFGRYAEMRKPKHYTSATKSLLDEVVRHTNGSVGSLKAWTTEIEKGRQTTDESIISTVNAYFEQLEEGITAAEFALHHRCHLRWLRFRSIRPLKKFLPVSKCCLDPLADLMLGMKQTCGSCKL